MRASVNHSVTHPPRMMHHPWSRGVVGWPLRVATDAPSHLRLRVRHVRSSVSIDRDVHWFVRWASPTAMGQISSFRTDSLRSGLWTIGSFLSCGTPITGGGWVSLDLSSSIGCLPNPWIHPDTDQWPSETDTAAIESFRCVHELPRWCMTSVPTYWRDGFMDPLDHRSRASIDIPPSSRDSLQRWVTVSWPVRATGRVQHVIQGYLGGLALYRVSWTAWATLLLRVRVAARSRMCTEREDGQ